MNNLTRLLLGSGASLILGLTASPALAALPPSPGGNAAVVERIEYTNPDGTYSRDFRSVTRFIANEYYTANSRDQEVIDGNPSDYKQHYMLSPKVTKMTSQLTFTEGGVTCRTNSQTVLTNDEVRTQKSHSSC